MHYVLHWREIGLARHKLVRLFLAKVYKLEQSPRFLYALAKSVALATLLQALMTMFLQLLKAVDSVFMINIFIF